MAHHFAGIRPDFGIFSIPESISLHASLFQLGSFYLSADCYSNLLLLLIKLLLVAFTQQSVSSSILLLFGVAGYADPLTHMDPVNQTNKNW